MEVLLLLNALEGQHRVLKLGAWRSLTNGVNEDGIGEVQSRYDSGRKVLGIT